MKNKPVLLLVLPALLLGFGINPSWAEKEAVSAFYKRLFNSAQILKNARPADKEGRVEDLELFWLAEMLAAEEQHMPANQHWQYLKDYFTHSPLLLLTPPFPEDTPYLQEFNPDPEFSRLVKTAYTRIPENYQSVQHREFKALAYLLVRQVETVLGEHPKKGFQDFIRKFPESEYTGWAAYQLAWLYWLEHQGSTRLMGEFWQQHQEHPLASETQEAMEVPYYSPCQLSFLSSLVPGWGEETLEPGLQLSSGLWYSEIMFMAGAIAFALAAQSSDRINNLAGALISANFLFLNHQGSAEKVYVLAHRRNIAQKRKFSLDRIDVPVLGTGRFVLPEYPEPQPESMANEFIFSLVYNAQNVGHAFLEQGVVENDDLINLGFRLEYITSLLDIWRGDIFSFGIAVVPQGRFLLNAPATKNSQDDSRLETREMAVGGELALLTRVALGTRWIQLRLSGGPAYRLRSLSINQYAYSEQGLATSVTLALNWGGFSGTYWHLGFYYDDSFQARDFVYQSETLSVPSHSLGFQFGLGIRF
ncbi:hypothetical protein KAR34_06775 [bacterium]|nr:hypothetical protein [bacterium]